jgi:hypothetical protein
LLMKQAEPALCWFLAWFNLQPWKWWQHVLQNVNWLSLVYTLLYPTK